MKAELDTMAVHALEPGIRVASMTRSLRFWRDIVGCVPYAEIFVPGAHVVGLNFGNSMIKLMELTSLVGEEDIPDGVDGKASHTGGAHYFTIHVLNAEELQIASAAEGLPVIVPFSEFRPSRLGDPTCFYAIVKDPDGNTVEFSQGSPWVAPTSAFRGLWPQL